MRDACLGQDAARWAQARLVQQPAGARTQQSWKGTSLTSQASDLSDTTRDAFLGGRLVVEQPSAGYRAGLDAVLLAAACPARAGDSVLDAGAGVGVAGLCVASRVPGARVTLVEREPDLAKLAARNARANALEAVVDVIAADLLAPLSQISGLAGRIGTFRHVLANPPFHETGSGTRATDPLKAVSHAMDAGTLHDWARFLAAMAKPGGSITLIHRAEAVGDILSALARRFGALDVMPVHPRRTTPASRVLIRGIKASRSPISLLPPLVLHEDEGPAFRPDIEAVLRDGCALDWPKARRT